MNNVLLHRYEKDNLCLQVFKTDKGTIEVDIIKPSDVRLYCNFENIKTKNIDTIIKDHMEVET